MASLEALRAASNKVQSCIEDSPDTLQQAETNGGGIPVFWQIQRGSLVAWLECAEDLQYYQAVLPYNMLDDVVSIMTEQDVRNVLDTYGVDEAFESEEERKAHAAKLILNETPEEAAQSFANGLLQLLSQPKLSFSFETTDEGVVYGFRVEKAIYPQYDTFEYRDYDEAVQTVVTVGNSAISYARQSLQVEEMVAAHESPEPLPYFQ